MPANTCKVTDMAFLISCLKHVNGTIDVHEVGKECGGMTANAVNKQIKRIKEAKPAAIEDGDGAVEAADGKKATKGAAKKTAATKKRKFEKEADDTDEQIKGEDDEAELE